MLAEQTKHVEQKAPMIMVAGIGNDYRRDDAAGLLVVRELRKWLGPKVGKAPVRIIECTGGDDFELIDEWQGAGVVVLVDAISCNADPGTAFRIEVHKQPIPTCLFQHSTHGFNVAHVIELARTLEKLPPKVVVFGIQGADFGEGQGLSEEVALAVERVTLNVLAYVRDCVEQGER